MKRTANEPEKTEKAENSAQTAPARPSAVGAWVLAARPKTLSAAFVPVLVGVSLGAADLAARGAVDSFSVLAAFCCCGFALLSQIAANFANDYSDYKKGADGEERKGPARAVASGWISPRAMAVGTFVALAAACVCGLALIPIGGWNLVAVGVLSCVFCLLYSAGPLPLAYIGLGDVLVVAFFGFVAVGFTYFLQVGEITRDAALVGLAIGFATDNILVANNYRDRDEDRKNRKFTLIAIFGERFGRYFYLANGLIVVGLLAASFSRRGDWGASTVALLLFYLFLHVRAWRTLCRIGSGRGLIRVLELSSKNLLVLGVWLAAIFFDAAF